MDFLNWRMFQISRSSQEWIKHKIRYHHPISTRKMILRNDEKQPINESKMLFILSSLNFYSRNFDFKMDYR